MTFTADVDTSAKFTPEVKRWESWFIQVQSGAHLRSQYNQSIETISQYNQCKEGSVDNDQGIMAG